MHIPSALAVKKRTVSMARTIRLCALIVGAVGALVACSVEQPGEDESVGRAISAEEVFCTATPPLDDVAPTPPPAPPPMPEDGIHALGTFPYSIPPSQVNACGKCWMRRPSGADKGEIGDATFCSSQEARCCPAGFVGTCTTDPNAVQCTRVPTPQAGDTCYDLLGNVIAAAGVAWGGVQIFGGPKTPAAATQIARIACRATGNVLACQSEASTGCATIFKGVPTAIKACVELTNLACLACTSTLAPM
jgi:hypothetical protein